MKRETSIKFLGEIIDKNISWKQHIDLIQNKMSKNIRMLYLTEKVFKNIHFSFIHNYVSYCSISWASTTKTKFHPLLIKQKYTVRTTYHEHRYTHSKPLMRDIKTINVYQLNIFQVLKLILCVKQKIRQTPETLMRHLTTRHLTGNHNYSTHFSKASFKQTKIIAKATSFAIFSRGLYVWSNYLDDSEKWIPFIPVFLNKVIEKISRI